MQMRGIVSGGRFTAHTDDVDAYHALPWHEKLRKGTNLEKFLLKKYGRVIYRGGSYDRG